jgi:pimeloyl-ACP methyl ester carboxylesterase
LNDWEDTALLWHKTVGTGPEKVIAVHGWFGDHRAYATMFDLLDKSRYSWAFVDIRGYGNSRNLDGAYSIEEIAHDSIQLADELGWRDFHVVGHSMAVRPRRK